MTAGLITTTGSSIFGVCSKTLTPAAVRTPLAIYHIVFNNKLAAISASVARNKNPKERMIACDSSTAEVTDEQRFM